MTVYDCMTVFWRCLLYRDREKHGTHLCFEIHWVRTPLVLSARTVASSTRPSRWPAASPPRRLATLLMRTCCSVPHAMATMHHDDCFPMIAMMNFARCSSLLENAGSLQTAYARFPLLCTSSRTLQLPVEACSFVTLQSII